MGTALGLLLHLGAAALGAGAAAALFCKLVQAGPDRWLRARPWGNLAQADVFVVFGFGLTKAADGREGPGASNQALAEWLLANNPFPQRPAIVQEGVYLALREKEAAQPGLVLASWVIPLPHNPHVYVDTAGATLQCWALMTLLGYRRPVLVSHDLQLQRMALNFDRAGLGEQAVIPDLPPTPYDPVSTQPWTRSRGRWILWELLLARPRRGVHLWLPAALGLFVAAGAGAGAWLATLLR